MSNKLKELLARVSKETYDKVSKQMTCAYYFNGGDCSKGLPGTPCVLEGCVAWRLHPDFEKKRTPVEIKDGKVWDANTEKEI